MPPVRAAQPELNEVSGFQQSSFDTATNDSFPDMFPGWKSSRPAIDKTRSPSLRSKKVIRSRVRSSVERIPIESQPNRDTQGRLRMRQRGNTVRGNSAH